MWWQSIIVWFLGAIVLHDLVLFPFYALADRSLGAGWRAVTGRAPHATPLVSPRNYLRIPAMASGLLLLMFFPGIIRQGSASYQRATGLTQQPFLGRWLLLTGAFFGASAIAYAARTVQVRAAGRQRPMSDPTARRRRSRSDGAPGPPGGTAMVTLDTAPPSGAARAGCAHGPVPVPVRHVVGTDVLYRHISTGQPCWISTSDGATMPLAIGRWLGGAARPRRTGPSTRPSSTAAPDPPSMSDAAPEGSRRPWPSGGSRRSAWTCRRPPSR